MKRHIDDSAGITYAGSVAVDQAFDTIGMFATTTTPATMPTTMASATRVRVASLRTRRRVMAGIYLSAPTRARTWDLRIKSP
ncbi:putative two-component histidine kinase [Mycolicibacterium novocastrense]|uniref:Two-component histidine kinase n=1 Tax=Mycolicibacterium novocastrense TaxID=59813 RepID=A0ABQ0KRF0_MYCNV|nr:putative two-component histidine kinase [Mycolicibacterium novocastrense]